MQEKKRSPVGKLTSRASFLNHNRNWKKTIAKREESHWRKKKHPRHRGKNKKQKKTWSSSRTWSLESKPNGINLPLPDTLFHTLSIIGRRTVMFTQSDTRRVCHSFLPQTFIQLCCFFQALEQESANEGPWLLHFLVAVGNKRRKRGLICDV